MKSKSLFLCGVLLLSFPLLALTAHRDDPPAVGYNLEPGFPTDLADAYAIEPNIFTAQGFFRYEETEDNEDLFLFRPKILYGLLPFAHVEVSTTLRAGDADRTGSRDLRLAGHYQFLDEQGLVPALAILPAVDVPTGKDSRGLDTTLTLAATRSLDLLGGEDRLHFNLSWLRNAGGENNERENYYRAIFGYSRQFTDEFTLVADFVREEQRIKGRASNILEGGALYHLNERVLLSFSIGAGIAEESPKFRIGSGFQWTF